MRPEEVRVACALQTHLGGPRHVQFRPGSDPPDIELVLNGFHIGVEVTRLTQTVSVANGNRQVRATQDEFALRAVDELDASLGSLLSAELQLIVTMWMPTTDGRKFKAQLRAWVKRLVVAASAGYEEEQCLAGARVVLRIASRWTAGRSIWGIAANAHSSADISSNAAQILHDRISTKAKACRNLLGPVWLAFLNDYWLADAATWKKALDSLRLKHRFERLLLVSEDGNVTELN